ncbi:MAG: MFS transporter, partial [Melioribacter sp.]|nr:MFS transporter [Melioribacter sp.]
MTNNDAYAALRIKDYRWFIIARVTLTFAIQIQSVIVGWQVYELTHDALSLGLIGLAEAIPYLCIALFAGHVADIFNRKKIILYAGTIYLLCALLLFLVSTELHPILLKFGAYPIFTIIFITGLARGFISPALNAFAAQLVPRHLFGNASTWNSMLWQTAAITGPALGGLVYGFCGIGQAYFLVIFFSALSWFFFSIIEKKPMPERTKEENIWQSLSTGLKFVFKDQIILGAISLDMIAVFFGGAVSILPIFADKILHSGAEGLGLLRAAPAVGALIMSYVQAHNPLFKNAGRNLLICVLGFGVTTILFALSDNIYLVFSLLMLGGMFDNVSVIIRQTIIQLFTPDEMRGRVSS